MKSKQPAVKSYNTTQHVHYITIQISKGNVSVSPMMKSRIDVVIKIKNN